MLWYRKHGHNVDWYLRVAAKGAHVKALDTEPHLTHCELFYYNMHTACGNDINKIKSFCELHLMTFDEIIESLYILQDISFRVN